MPQSTLPIRLPFQKFFLVLTLAFISSVASAQVTVSIDTSTKFQTIEGWGHGGGIFSMLNYGLDSTIRDPYNEQMLDYIIDELGLTGSRTWEIGPRIDGTPTDDGDCDSVDWNTFQLGTYDTMIAKYMVYFKNRLNAEGFQTSFYSSPGYPTHASDQKPWIMYDPGERAQQIWANALWWKKNYGIDINYDVICNEPLGAYTSPVLAADVKALGPRALAAGVVTKTQFAECVAPQTDWNYIDPEIGDSALWKYVGRISYHNYGTADPYRSFLHGLADSLGITTAQTEMQDPTISDIFQDMLFGGTSYWEVAYSGNQTLTPTSGNTGFIPSGTFFRLRQAIHYIRPGAMRVNAVSSDTNIWVLSFVRNKAVTTVVLNNRSATTIALSGLPPGKYGLSQSISGAKLSQELGIQTVGADGALTFNSGVNGVVSTLYPYAGSNLPPDILSWTATSGFIFQPATRDTLTVSATDPELDPLTYNWSVTSQPAGASAVLATPTKATTPVSGLTQTGDYVFTVTVSDGANTTSKKVFLIVYPSNLPPQMGQAGFRFGVPYGLIFTNPGDTTHANIELPLSKGILQVGIGDLANDDFTGRGKWKLVSEPPGANAIVDTTIYIFISIRANVSNMTVPGDYVFQVNITNPGHPDLTARVICTVHATSSGPQIHSIAINPTSPALPVDTAMLTSNTVDTSGQQLRYWWVVNKAPAGANVTFDHQGLANTTVRGLTVSGNYTIVLRAFDDIHIDTMLYSFLVTAASSVSQTSLPETILTFPNPVSNELTVQFSDGMDPATLTLTNALGERIAELYTSASEATLPMNALPTGIYILTVKRNGQMESRKIVKE